VCLGGWLCCGSFGGCGLVVCLMVVSLNANEEETGLTRCSPGPLELDGQRGRRRLLGS
jgi:hypothetical protein